MPVPAGATSSSIKCMYTTKCYRFHLIYVHVITISSPNWKKSLQRTRYNTREELIRAIGQSIQNINKDGCTDCVRHLPNTWQKVINKGMTTLKVHKCCTTVNKAMPKISNGCHYLLMSVLYNLITVIFPILC